MNEPEQFANIGTGEILYQKGNYAIVVTKFTIKPPGSANPLFRVVNLATGVESQLYNMEQCVEIVKLCVSNELLGSFN